jgi:hypothetical protein
MRIQIHSQMYHTQGFLSANEPSKSKYAQLYIYDPEFASSVRCSNNNKVHNKKKLDDVIISNLVQWFINQIFLLCFIRQRMSFLLLIIMRLTILKPLLFEFFLYRGWNWLLEQTKGLRTFQNQMK